MHSRTALLLLVSSVTAFPRVYQRQETTLQPLPSDAASSVLLSSIGIAGTSQIFESQLSSMQGSSAMSVSATSGGVAALPSASSVPLAITCPEGYQSGSYNITRELSATAISVASQIGDFLNATWQEANSQAQQTDTTSGQGQFVGATRSFTVNGQTLQETLTSYVSDNTTGSLNRTWVLSNPSVDFGGQQATLASYSQELQLAPSGSSENSTLTWNTVFCAGDTALFESFFQQLHQPPVDALSNSTAAQAQESLSVQSVASVSTQALVSSLLAVAESASNAAASLTAQAQPASTTSADGQISTVFVTLSPTATP